MGSLEFPGVDADEVYPRVYIGNKASATTPAFLSSRGITHVLNAAEGSSVGFADVHADFYKSLGIEFLGIPVLDTPQANISKYFTLVSDFLESGLNTGGS